MMGGRDQNAHWSSQFREVGVAWQVRHSHLRGPAVWCRLRARLLSDLARLSSRGVRLGAPSSPALMMR